MKIIIIGKLASYKEETTRTIIKVWDFTGLSDDIIFFHKNQNQKATLDMYKIE